MRKKTILINALVIFLVSCFVHFLYDIYPSFITSIIAPVNESIFEHIKMLFTASIASSIITDIILKRKISSFFIFNKALLSIIILLLLYLPCYYFFGEHLLLTFIILFLTLIFSEIISLNIIKTNFPFKNLIGIILISSAYIVFAYLTYHPLPTFLFYDPVTKGFGIKKDK